MPIPVLHNQDEHSRENARGLRLVGEASNPSKGLLLYGRGFSHVLDMGVLSGVSVYVAKIFSVFLVAAHARAISSSGNIAASVFQQAFEYSSSQLFAASFASLSVLYFIAIPLVFGRTPGQAVLGLRVSSLDGSAPSLRQLVLRLGGLACNYGSGGFFCLSGLRSPDAKFLQDAVSDSKIERD